jgi:PKD repeat protein
MLLIKKGVNHIRYTKPLTILFITAILFFGCNKDEGPSQPAIPDPVASFTESGQFVTPATINFQNTSQNADTYLWNFGDGTTSNVTNPSKTYNAHGVYTVTLTATNSSTTKSNLKSKQLTITPGKVFVEKITVDQIPFTDSSGIAWDFGSGPDLYPNFDDNNNILVSFSTSYASNIAPSSLPLTWTLSPTYEITDWSKAFFVVLWDYDPLDADDYIGAPYGFRINDVISLSGYTTSVSLQNASGSIKVRVILKWQ